MFGTEAFAYCPQDALADCFPKVFFEAKKKTVISNVGQIIFVLASRRDSKALPP